MKNLTMRPTGGLLPSHYSERKTNVRFGSKADIARCQADVRFTPNSGHGSVGVPKADINRVTRSSLLVCLNAIAPIPLR
jgi:hypothetical protein